MTGRIERIREYLEEAKYDKRLLVLFFLFLLVGVGAGFGTIAFPGSGADGNESTPTPTVVTMTPTTPTPAPTPGGGPPAATATSTPTPTPTDTATPTETRRDDDDDDDRPSRVDLTADGNRMLVQASGMAPGDDGQNSVTFENSGDATGRLVVDDADVTDYENSLLDPEQAVGDDAATGELSSALQVRLSVTYSDGTTEYLFGTSSQYVTLESIDGESRESTETLAGGEQATVTFEWTLPKATGNEVQSDGSEFDVDFVLRQTS